MTDEELEQQDKQEQKEEKKELAKRDLKIIITSIVCTLLFIIILLLLVLLGLKKCNKDNSGLPSSSAPSSSIKYDYDVDEIDDVFKKIVKKQLIVDGFDEDPLKDVISVTYRQIWTCANFKLTNICW